jgi:uncharacterized protein (TIGR02145 family)
MLKLLFAFPFLFSTCFAFAQSIEVTHVAQEGTDLQVHYGFTGGTDSCTVSLHYSLDNGNTWLGPAKAVSGDVGKGIKPGYNKSIIWKVLADREHLKGENLRFKVMAKSEGETVTDIDGHVYQTVKIGNQVWMKENLKTSHYRDGSAISTNLSKPHWASTTNGAYAIYDNKAENDVIYGKLYNWYAVADSRGLCPVGWHVPSDAEWTDLKNFLGGGYGVGTKMKSSNGWASNGNGTNESAFSGLPGGARNNINGVYFGLGSYTYWWSTDEVDLKFARNWQLQFYHFSVYQSYSNKEVGFSVRCLKD